MQESPLSPEVCDYEGATYRTDFWKGRGRDYEDRVERLALRKLLPDSGLRLLEIGAGFGRLTEEYHAYEQVVLLDYSFSQLQYARQKLGDRDRTIFVAANAYKLPFRAGVFDGATMIRVLHHMVEVPAILNQIRRVLIPESTFILEFANKRNVKSILRYALKMQGWNPFTLDPVEFVALNFDFHPQYIQQSLNDAGFETETQIPVSFFRLPILKNTVPTRVLAGADNVMQRSRLLFTPSIFTGNRASGESPNNLNTEDIFACPECGDKLSRQADRLYCEIDQFAWAYRDGVYDFKEPVEGS